MKTKYKVFSAFIFFLTALILLPIACFAIPTKPGNEGGSSSTTSYNGANKISSDSTLENITYTSSTGSQNALLVSGGTSTLNNPTINKSGDSSDENSNFYGTNAALLTYNGATLNINGGTVTTNGSHANGIFAYGNSTININNTNIKTKKKQRILAPIYQTNKFKLMSPFSTSANF